LESRAIKELKIAGSILHLQNPGELEEGIRIKNLILCNYCATMEVSSSDYELIHQSTGQTVVEIRISSLKPKLFPEVEGQRKPRCKV